MDGHIRLAPAINNSPGPINAIVQRRVTGAGACACAGAHARVRRGPVSCARARGRSDRCCHLAPARNRAHGSGDRSDRGKHPAHGGYNEILIDFSWVSCAAGTPFWTPPPHYEFGFSNYARHWNLNYFYVSRRNDVAVASRATWNIEVPIPILRENVYNWSF